MSTNTAFDNIKCTCEDYYEQDELNLVCLSCNPTYYDSDEDSETDEDTPSELQTGLSLKLLTAPSPSECSVESQVYVMSTNTAFNNVECTCEDYYERNDLDLVCLSCNPTYYDSDEDTPSKLQTGLPLKKLTAPSNSECSVEIGASAPSLAESVPKDFDILPSSLDVTSSNSALNHANCTCTETHERNDINLVCLFCRPNNHYESDDDGATNDVLTKTFPCEHPQLQTVTPAASEGTVESEASTSTASSLAATAPKEIDFSLSSSCAISVSSSYLEELENMKSAAEIEINRLRKEVYTARKELKMLRRKRNEAKAVAKCSRGPKNMDILLAREHDKSKMMDLQVENHALLAEVEELSSLRVLLEDRDREIDSLREANVTRERTKTSRLRFAAKIVFAPLLVVGAVAKCAAQPLGTILTSRNPSSE